MSLKTYGCWKFGQYDSSNEVFRHCGLNAETSFEDALLEMKTPGRWTGDSAIRFVYRSFAEIPSFIMNRMNASHYCDFADRLFVQEGIMI